MARISNTSSYPIIAPEGADYFILTEFSYKETVSAIRGFKHKDVTIMLVETHRPGLIIGKGGRYMNAFIEFIKEEHDIDLKLELVENELFFQLYK